jgi:hypothetical protein
MQIDDSICPDREARDKREESSSKSDGVSHRSETPFLYDFYKKRSFYQDRLGTNVRKAHQSPMAFRTGAYRRRFAHMLRSIKSAGFNGLAILNVDAYVIDRF